MFMIQYIQSEYFLQEWKQLEISWINSLKVTLSHSVDIMFNIKKSGELNLIMAARLVSEIIYYEELFIKRFSLNDRIQWPS